MFRRVAVTDRQGARIFATFREKSIRRRVALPLLDYLIDMVTKPL